MKNKHIFSALGLFLSVFLLISCSEEKTRDNTEELNTPTKRREELPAIMWGEEKNDLILGIQTEKSEWKKNETAKFNVYIKNIGKRSVKIPFFFFGLSALQLNVYNEKKKRIYYIKVNLSTELGDPIILNPGDTVSDTQSVVLKKDSWDGSTGKYHVIAIYDTTEYKEKHLWSDKCIAGPLEFSVK